MARKVTIPGQNVPVQIGNAVNPDWYEKFKFLETLSPLTDIPALVLPSPLVPGSTSATVTTAALTDTSVPLGTPANTINFGAAPSIAQQQNNWATVVAYVNSIKTDLINAQTAVSGLNSRVTALENKINDLITALS
jgi:hypothetical protein